MVFVFFFCFALKVQDGHQYTVEDEKEIEKEIDEIERKIKAVSDVKNYTWAEQKKRYCEAHFLLLKVKDWQPQL